MSVAHFRVAFSNPVDGAREGTVSIDRSVGLLSVRLLRRHRLYELPLSWVAENVVWKVIRAEMTERRREKRVKRRIVRKAGGS